MEKAANSPNPEGPHPKLPPLLELNRQGRKTSPYPFLISPSTRRIFRPTSFLLVVTFTFTQITPAWGQVPLRDEEDGRGDQVPLQLAQAGLQSQNQELQQRMLVSQAVQSQAAPRSSRIIINRIIPQNLGDIPPESVGDGGLVRVSRVLELQDAQTQTHSLSLKTGWNLLTFPGDRSTLPSVSEIVRQLDSQNIPHGSLWHWNGGQYLQVSNLQPGKSYWLRVDQVASLTVTTRPAQEVVLDLQQAGAAMIGNPFSEELPLDQVVITRGGESVTFPEAVSRGWLWPGFFTWDPTADNDQGGKGKYEPHRTDQGGPVPNIPVGQGIWVKPLEPLSMRQRPVDRTPPTGSVQVASGNLVQGTRYVRERNVNLNVTATEEGSGLRRVSYSFDQGQTWTDLSDVSPEQLSNLSITLPGEDGEKSLQIRLTDWAGHETILRLPEPITLDTIPPAVSLTSPTFTNTPAYTLTYTVDGVVTTETVTLAVEGENLITRTVTDNATNSTTKTFTITLDTVRPTVDMVLNEGARVTNQLTVTAALTARDLHPIVSMRFSEDGIRFGDAEPFAQTTARTFQGNAGDKTLFVQVQDAAGNWSVLPAQSSIRYDPTWIRAQETIQAGDKALTFVFNPFPGEPFNPLTEFVHWTAQQIDRVRQALRALVPAIVQLYGAPFFSMIVPFFQDPQFGGGEYRLSFTRDSDGQRIVVRRRLTLGTRLGLEQSWDALAHELAHAFHDMWVLRVPSVFFEEGMAEAINVLVFKLVPEWLPPVVEGSSSGAPDHNDHRAEDSVYYEAFRKPGLLGGYSSNFTAGDLFKRGYADMLWSKLWIEDHEFFVKFNRAYATRVMADPSIAEDQARLFELVKALKPTVEGQDMETWFRAQAALIPTEAELEPFLGERLYIRGSSPIQADVVRFTRNPSAGILAEQIPGTTVYREVLPGREVRLQVVGTQGELLYEERGLSSSFGVVGFSGDFEILATGYTGRATLTVSMPTSGGGVTTDVRYQSYRQGIRVPYRVTTSTFPTSLSGITTTINTGQITVTNLADSSMTFTTGLTNGMFYLPDFPKVAGSFRVTYRNPITGEQLSRVITKDEASYYVQLDTAPLTAGKTTAAVAEPTAIVSTNGHEATVRVRADAPLARATLLYRKQGGSGLVRVEGLPPADSRADFTVSLSGLYSETAYEFWIEGEDRYGWSVASPHAVFTTPDVTPPTLSVPVNAIPPFTRARTLTVPWSASEPVGVTWTLLRPDGTQASGTAGPADLTLEEPFMAQEGRYTLTLRATDRANHEATHSRTFTIDRTPPTLTLTSPTLTNAQEDLGYDWQEGQWIRGYKLRYTVDGIGPVSGLGAAPFYEERIRSDQLREGANEITRSFTDSAGNTATVTWTITRDTVPPKYVLLSPALTNQRSYTLRYTVDGDLREEPVELSREGTNRFLRSTTDAAGNPGWGSFDIILDTTAPVVDPAPGQPSGVDRAPFWNPLTNQRGYQLRYSVDGIIREEQVALEQEGLNEITRAFRDEAGNEMTATWRITRDTAPPVAKLTSPSLTNQTAEETRLENGTVLWTLVTPISYTVDGQSRSEQVKVLESRGIPLLAPFEKTVVVTRTFADLAGNSTTVAWTILIDKKPPEFVLTSPVIVNTPVYRLTYTVDGAPREEDVALQEGTNQVIRDATDPAGNSNKATWTITLDTVPPRLEFLSSTLTNQAAYTLRYRIDGQEEVITFTVVLREGPNAITRTVQDAAGNTTTATHVVTLDIVPPEIVFTSPRRVNDASYRLTYTVDGVAKEGMFTLVEGNNPLTVTEVDAADNQTIAVYDVFYDRLPVLTLVSITLTNQPAYTLRYRVDGATLEERVNLVEGPNVITRRAVSNGGTEVFATWTVQLDTVAPQMELLSNAITNQADYRLRYRIDDRIKEEAVLLTSVLLTNGKRTFTRSATDLAGNTTTVNWEIELDTKPPFAELKSSSVVNTPAYLLRYTADGEVRSENVTLKEGANAIFRRITDRAGNASEVTWTITLDTQPPVVMLASPVLVNTPTYRLTYTVDGLLRAEDVALQEGPNTVTRTITDEAGNLTPVAWTISRDTIPPVATLASPTLTNERSYQLRLTVDGQERSEALTLSEGVNTLERTFTDTAGNASTLTWTITLDTRDPVMELTSQTLVNTPTYRLVYTVDGKEVVETVTLEEGVNTFTRVAADAAGNQATATWGVILDTVAPRLQLASSILTRHPAYRLSYLVDSQLREEDLTLQEGPNAITRAATDLAGNTSTLTWTITLDTLPPQFVLKSPTLSNRPAYTLEYTVDGQWRREALTLQEGENTLARTATDSAGNTGSTTFQITLDTLPPQVELLSPALTNQGDYLLQYGVDNRFVEERLNLSEGLNRLTRTSQDAAGNVTEATFAVTLDTQPPALQLVSSALTNQSAYTLRFSVDGQEQTEVVTLREGINQLTRAARDAAGNEAAATFNVTLDTVHPVVALTSPLFLLTDGSSYRLTYTVDGIPRAESVTLAEGENLLSRTIADEAGNTTTVEWVITFLPRPPPLTITSATSTSQPDYQLAATFGDQRIEESWRMGGGSHRLVLRAQDRFGREVVAQILVTREGASSQWQDPPANSLDPNVPLLTQTLTNGILARYQGTQLVGLEKPGEWSVESPTLDTESKLESGWIRFSDGRVFWVQNKVVRAVKETDGTVRFFDGDRIDHEHPPNGSIVSYAYRMNAQGQVTALVVTTDGRQSGRYTPDGTLEEVASADGSVLVFLQKMPDRLLIPGAATVRYLRQSRNGSATLLTRPPGQATHLPRILSYDSTGQLQEVGLEDGTKITLREGLPQQVVAPDGSVTKYEAGKSADGGLSFFTATRAGLSHRYDAQGKLTGLSFGDGTKLLLQGETLTGISLQEGLLTDATFSPEGKLLTGNLKRADGVLLKYLGGFLKEAILRDGSVVTYTNNEPTQLTLANGLTYAITRGSHRPDAPGEHFVATLILPDGQGPSAEAMTRMILSKEFELLEATRADGAELSYIDGRLTALVKDSATTRYSYDDAGRLVKTVTSPPSSQELSITTEYAYDKIRRVLRGDVPVYEYSYEFSATNSGGSASGGDAAGNEITVIREAETGIVKRYRDGLLISQTDPDGAVTSYEYTTNPNGYVDPLDSAAGLTQTLPGPNPLFDHNGVDSAPGKIGSAAHFTRSKGQFLSVPDSPDLSMEETSYTLAAWVYLDSKDDPNESVILSKWDENAGRYAEFRLIYYKSLDRFQFGTISYTGVHDSVTANSLGSPETGRWYHIVAWHQIGGADNIHRNYIQVNGGPVDSERSEGPSPSSAPLRIGVRSRAEDGFGYGFFGGRIDEVGIWRRLLTPEERATLYNSGSGNPASLFQNQLVAYYPLEEASGTRENGVGSVVAHYEPVDSPSGRVFEPVKVTFPDGSELVDREGVGNHLTDHNSVYYAEGKIGNAAHFTRSKGQYLSVADNPTLSFEVDNSPPGFSVAAWVYLDSKPDQPNEVVILSKWDENAGRYSEFRLIYHKEVDRFQFTTISSTGVESVVTANSLGSPEVGRWYYVIAWHEENHPASIRNDYIQVNGGPVDSVPSQGLSSSSAPLRIGARFQGDVRYGSFNGRIDEVGIWKRLLTPQERAGLYNSGNGNRYRPERQAFDLDATASLTQNLVAYYPLDETSDTRLDATDPNPPLHLTDHNTVSSAAGKLGSAAQFSRSKGQYLSVPDSPDLSLEEGSYTLAAWVYLDSKPDEPNESVILSKWDENAGRYSEFQLIYYKSLDRFQFSTISYTGVHDSVTANAFGAPETGRWYYIVAWHDIGSNNLHRNYIQVNGGPVDSERSDGPGPSSAPLRIGVRSRDAANNRPFWDGRIDEVGIWNRLLTPEERATLYNRGQGNPYRPERRAFDLDATASLTQNLVAYYPLDETSGARLDATDVSAFFARLPLPTDRLIFRRMLERGLLKLIPSSGSSGFSQRSTLLRYIQSLIERGAIVMPIIFSGSPPPAPTPVLAKATVTYQGKVRESFTYSYISGLTLVTDQAGTTRIYDDTKRLVALKQLDGNEYQILYSRDLSDEQVARLKTAQPDLSLFTRPNGEEVTIQTLIRRVLPDGLQLLFDNGRLNQLLLPDGKKLTQLSFDRSNVPLRALLTMPDGTTAAVQNGPLTEVSRPDGVKLRYRDDNIAEISVPMTDGPPMTLSGLALDGSGRLKRGEILLPTGDRLALRQGVLTAARLADGTEAQSIAVTRNALTGATLKVEGSSATLNNTRDVSVTLPSGQVYRYWYRRDEAGWPTQELETMTFVDDFEDGNALGWRTTGGWSVNAGNLRGAVGLNPSDSAGSIYAQTGLNWADYTVSANFTYEQLTGRPSEARLLFRYQDDNNHHIAQTIYSVGGDHPGWYLMLGVRSGGQTSERLWVPLTGFNDQDRHTLTIQVRGSNFRVYLDGDLKGDFSDSQFSRGSIGFSVRGAAVNFHDIEAIFPGEDLRDPATAQIDEKLRALRPVVAKASAALNRVGAVPARYDSASVDQGSVRVLQPSINPSVLIAVEALRSAAADPALVVASELDTQGLPLTAVRADGSTVIYESGRPSQMLDSEGKLQVTYTYDSSGSLTRTTLVTARQRVEEEIAASRRQVERRRAEALRQLAQQRGVATQELDQQVSQARGQLDAQKNQLTNQLRDLEGTKVHGKKAKKQKSNAMDQIRDGINKINDALGSLDRQYAEALGRLNSQIADLNRDIETKTQDAFRQIDTQRTEFLKSILRQEIHPILVNMFRKVIGRDPSPSELDQFVERMYNRTGGNPNVPVDLAVLEQEIKALADYQARASQVAEIRRQVTDWLTRYQSLRDSEAAEAISALGLSPSDIVPLSSSDISRILEWLNSRSLHFGHSAFLALQEFLASQGITALPIPLARDAILQDILTGVINPKTTGELELSLATLARLARGKGAIAVPSQVEFNDLRPLLDAGQVIAHVDGNHYLVLTQIAADGTVTLREPNQGPTGTTLTQSKEEFVKRWKGFVLSPRSPPKPHQVLTEREARQITGSFFPFIFAIIVAIASAIGTAVTAIVTAVTTLLTALGTLLTGVFTSIGTAIGGIFQGLGAIFSGNFLGGLATIGKGLLGGIVGLIDAGLGFLGIGSLAQLGTFEGLKTALITFVSKTVLATGVNLAVSKGLEALGVSPTIANLAGAFVSGGLMGAINPLEGVSVLRSAIGGALTSTAVAGTQLGLVKAGLDPTLAGLAGIGAGSIVGSLTTGVTLPNGDRLTGLKALGHTLTQQLAPTVAGELAFFGVQKLGESIGLDPRISQLLGAPIRSGINPGVDSQTGKTRTVADAIGRGFLEGAASVGLQMATSNFNPLLGSFASAAVMGAIDGLVSPNIQKDSKTGEPIIDPATGKPKLVDKNGDGNIDSRDSKGIFAGLNEAFTHALGGFTEIGLIKLGDPVGNAQRLQKLNDFSSIIREQGLGSALDQFATSLLHRSSIESLLNAGTSVRQYGTIKEAIDAKLPTANDTQLEGQSVKELAFGDKLSLYYDPATYSLKGIKEDELLRLYQEVKADRESKTAGMAKGAVTRTYKDSDGRTVTSRTRTTIRDGAASEITLQDAQGNTYAATPNSFQHIRLNADGSVDDGVLIDAKTGDVIRFKNGIPDRTKIRVNREEVLQPIGRPNFDAATQEVANRIRTLGEGMMAGEDIPPNDPGLEPDWMGFDWIFNGVDVLRTLEEGGPVSRLVPSLALAVVPFQKFAKPISKGLVGKFIKQYADNIAHAVTEKFAIFKGKFFGGAIGARLVGNWDDLTRQGVRVNYSQYQRLYTQSGRLHVFTENTFRDNLARLTGKTPIGMDAHHVLPQKFIAEFEKAGVNVHEPWFGSWWESTLNRGSAGIAYNNRWEGFFGTGIQRTKDEILELARDLGKEFKFDVNF